MTTRTEFEWDEAKAQSNLVKHAVPFNYAARVFLNDRSVDFDVSRTTDGEVRRKVVGVIDGRLFSVVYVRRGGAHSADLGTTLQRQGGATLWPATHSAVRLCHN